MKKIKAPGKKSNVVSTKPFPRTPEVPLPGRTGFAGPGVNVPMTPRNYKKGRGG